jgi:hypothetical protein
VTDPELIEYFDNFAFDEVLRHGRLPIRTRLMVVLSSLIACQALTEYRVMVGAALTVGVSPVEINPSLEVDNNGDAVPDCYQLGASGSNTAAWTRTDDAHTGSYAQRVNIGAYTSGDRKLVIKQDTGGCAPVVTPGHSYRLSAWYKEGPTRFLVYYRDTAGVWRYWTQGPLQPARPTWTQATWTTPALPAEATALSFGLNLTQVGTLITDDYAMTDTTQGQQVLPTPTTGEA